MKAPTLLVLTDFSKAAEHALHYATRLAGPLGAQLVLLHVRRDSVLDPEALTGELDHLSTSAVQLALNSLARGLPVPVVTEVGHGQVLDGVVEAVQRHHPVLVVVGRPNSDDFPDEVVSTTALDILQHAPYPLLVVPSPVPHAGGVPRRLLLAADGEPFVLGEFAGSAHALLRALHAELTVLHSAPPDGLGDATALESVLESGLADDLPPPRPHHVQADSAAEGILATAQPANCDAVMLLARRRSVLGRLFHHSVTAHVVLHSTMPVLVLPVS